MDSLTTCYGKTSKPTDYNVYSGKGMSQDVQEILQFEKIESVIGVAHDWCVTLTMCFVASAESLFHSKDNEVIKNYMGAEGGARKWFEGGKMAEYPAYLTEE
ncbi:hypothetical protein M7I_6872 [Glarea lozoyensis 74030]|uniref:Uncharacterized protein n=1 Tax=Glarea lozoyensis (strain ATCC 74030 / MF5533) TaxID=1104152 RepID=H0EVR7_GLAL7|nr:hypothetical protein M7I_6872 [Glarea lozoyensis 74030]